MKGPCKICGWEDTIVGMQQSKEPDEWFYYCWFHAQKVRPDLAEPEFGYNYYREWLMSHPEVIKNQLEVMPEVALEI